MKKFFKRFEALMSATAFAEANEHGTAIELAKEGNERTAETPRPVRSPFPGGIAGAAAGGK